MACSRPCWRAMRAPCSKRCATWPSRGRTGAACLPKYSTAPRRDRPGLPEAIDNGQGDRERVLALAQALPAEDVQFYYQMGLIGRRDLPLAPDRVAASGDGVAADARVPPGGRRRRAEDAAKGPGDQQGHDDPANSRGRRGLACAGRCRCCRARRGCARRSPGCPAGSAIRRRRRSSASRKRLSKSPPPRQRSSTCPGKSRLRASLPSPSPSPSPSRAPSPSPSPSPSAVEAPSVPPAVAVEAVVETVLEAPAGCVAGST